MDSQANVAHPGDVHVDKGVCIIYSFWFKTREHGTLDFLAPVILMDFPYMCGPDFWAMGCRKIFGHATL